LSDLRFTTAPPLDERRRALRDALPGLVPGWRPLARDVLGDDARIDWVGRDGEGRCVIALVSEEGEDAGLLTQGLAQREWVSARLPDWAQLAPEAGLRTDLAVEAVLLAPSFGLATRAAARALSDSGLRLARLRFVENGTGVAPLLELVEPHGSDVAPPGRDAAGFRSGLTPADLDLSPEERAAFEES
jgi:hypothetical protein